MGDALPTVARCLKPLPLPLISSWAASPMARTFTASWLLRKASIAIAGSAPRATSSRQMVMIGAAQTTTMSPTMTVSLPTISAWIGLDNAGTARIVRAGDVRGISARDVVEKSRPAALPTRCGAFFFSDLVIVTTLIAGVAMVIGQNPIGWFDTRTKSPLASVPTFRMV